VPKPEKIATVEEIKEKLSSAKIAILTEFQGLNVAEVTELRKLFRNADVDYKVYKNTLTRIAAQQLGLSGVEKFLVGTTALAFSKDNPIASAKIVKDFSSKHRNFKVKAGVLDKKLIASDDVIASQYTFQRGITCFSFRGDTGSYFRIAKRTSRSHKESYLGFEEPGGTKGKRRKRL